MSRDLTIVNWSPERRSERVERFLARPAFPAEAEAVAERILRDIREGGLDRIVHYARQFDCPTLETDSLRVTPAEFAAARRDVSAGIRAAIRDARRRIAAFAQAGLRKDWAMPTEGGGRLGERFVPYERVGVYVPGGMAPLASTVLMTVTLARVARVTEIVGCTPCNRDGKVNSAILAAFDAVGCREVYRVGGAQAIGLMAYGAGPIRAVQKIVGPGNAYVTAAKRQVYGSVALDLVAGPSEIAILADDTARPDWVAMDLLSQAEHGTGWEKALLATPSRALAETVAAQLPVQTAKLRATPGLQRVLNDGLMLAVTPDLQAAVELVNAFAPEHLEIMTRRPAAVARRIKRAGAIFTGPWSPESAGDFAAGPSHVLPTGGAARLFSGLTVSDFQRRCSVISLTKRDLRDMLPTIEQFGQLEGLDAHRLSARMRFEP